MTVTPKILPKRCEWSRRHIPDYFPAYDFAMAVTRGGKTLFKCRWKLVAIMCGWSKSRAGRALTWLEKEGWIVRVCVDDFGVWTYRVLSHSAWLAADPNRTCRALPQLENWNDDDEPSRSTSESPAPVAEQPASPAALISPYQPEEKPNQPTNVNPVGGLANSLSERARQTIATVRSFDKIFQSPPTRFYPTINAIAETDPRVLKRALDDFSERGFVGLQFSPAAWGIFTTEMPERIETARRQLKVDDASASWQSARQIERDRIASEGRQEIIKEIAERDAESEALNVGAEEMSA